MFNYMKKRTKITFWVLGSVLALLLIYLFLATKVLNNYPAKINLNHRPGEFGATFSKEFCDDLKLDWKEAYLAMLDDLKVRYLRLPAYWEEIEKTEGTYDFTDLDYMVNQASDRDAKIIITVGRRQPRWPECHSPAWTNKNNDSENNAKLLKLIEAIVLRYKGNPHIINWQVENEAFLSTFGVCPKLDKNFLQEEVSLVRSLDSRPIIITGSGELSSWKNEAKTGDVFGTTMYRVVYNSVIGYVKYFWSSDYYRLKAKLAGINPDEALIIELQTEPWVDRGSMAYLTKDQINQSMSIDQFKANLQYALNVNFKQIYVWGVEWWYWQKLYGNSEYWEIGKTLFN